ncbi:MAG: NAD(P)H-dependent oxidoreductase [bacterium]|nr:NAD(P)H-dependent oxidoreductase [bacterium]
MLKKIFYKIGTFVPLLIFSTMAHLGQEAARIGLDLAFVLMIIYFVLARVYSKISYFDIGFFSLFLIGFTSSHLFGDRLFKVFIDYTQANIYLTLTLVAFIPLLLGKEPFTYHFAKEGEPEIVWQTPQFKAINFIITLVWGTIFLVSFLISLAKPINLPFTILFPVALQLGIGLIFTLKFPKSYLKRNLSGEAFSAYESLLKLNKRRKGMKILGIVGSPHRKMGNTYQLVSYVMEEAKRLGAETEIVILSDLKIGYCQGCGRCLSEGECPQDDDMKGLVEKIFGADGIIMASPTYIFSVTAQMKTFLDRCVWLGHRPQLQGKYGVAISVSAGYGEEETANYLSGVLSALGASVVGRVYGIGVTPGEFSDKESLFAQAKRTGANLIAAIGEKRDYPTTGNKTIFHKFMRDLVSSHHKFFRADYKYWQEMGWLDSDSAEKSTEEESLNSETNTQTFPKTCKEAIEGMPTAFVPKASRGLDAAIQFIVTGAEQGEWYLSIGDERCTCQAGRIENPDLTITTPSDIWLGISQGRLDGAACFMQGKYKVKGDMGLLMKFNEIFAAGGER